MGFCPVGFCPVGFCPVGFCPVGFCPVGFCPGFTQNSRASISTIEASVDIKCWI